MITIHINGCSGCGVNSIYVRRVKAYALRVDKPIIIINTKYDSLGREQHANLLIAAGLGCDQYEPIVVEAGVVTRLREWNK